MKRTHFFVLIFAAVLVFVVGLLPRAAQAAGAQAESQDSPASIRFEDFKTHVDGTQFSVILPFKGDFSSSEITANFTGESVQIEVPGASFPKGKHLLSTNGKVVKSVYVSQPDNETVRLKISLNKGFRAASLAKTFKVTRNNGTFDIAFNAGIEKSEASETEITTQTFAFDDSAAVNPLAKAAAQDAMKDEIIEQARLVARDSSPSSVAAPTTSTAATTTAANVSTTTTTSTAAAAAAAAPNSEATLLEADKSAVEAKVPLAADATKKLAENEIPLAVEKETKKPESAPWQRIVITLGVMVMLGVAASFGMKKWSASARGRVAKNARIKVLTQHHLGPKKSLMIVEVAGESMLIGVTDSNISMLKSLSLIDDEIPEQLPHSFENAIEQNFIESENHAKPRLKESRAQRTLAAASSLETALEDHDEGENFALHGLSEIRDKVSTRLKNMRPL